MESEGRPQQIYTEEEKAEIKKAYKDAHKPKDRSRLLSLKLRIVQGLTIEHISKITGYSYSAVRHLISSYNRYELKEILVKEYCGNHRNMTPEEEKKFLEPFKQQASAGEILEVSEIITA